MKSTVKRYSTEVSDLVLPLPRLPFAETEQLLFLPKTEIFIDKFSIDTDIVMKNM